MPITLNHSNISIQYSSDKSYIIETVKSDLYVKDSRIGISSNLTTEPSIIAATTTFTETIRTFVHSGGAEAQTTYTITVGRDTICDILVVGGGGGGGLGVSDMYEGGGGGAGGIVYMINKTLNAGTYKINVGKGGASNTNGNNSTITYSNDNNITFDNIQLIGRGGGKGAASAGGVGSDGGSGGGGCHPSTNGGLATQGNTFWNGTSYVAGGFNGGKAAANSRGAAGGGAGEIGETDGAGFGGDGRSVDISGVNTFYAGGGNSHPNSSTTRSDGGGGTLNGSLSYQNGGNALPNTGSGGAGAYAPGYSGGAGGSGIIIIKFKSLAGPILEGTTHKRLNFAFDSLGFSFDATKSVEYQAQLKTGVGGWRIVRYLPPNLGRWYQGDYINTSTFTIPTIGTPYNYTNEWAVSFGTFDEMFFATFDMTYWLHCLKTSVLGTYDNGARPIIKSSERNYAHSINWYNRTGTSVDPFISINDHTATPNLMVYADNNSPDHSSLRNAYGGMCVLVRDSTASTTIPNPNTYTLNFPVPTIADINNNSNIVLRGEYDLALGITNSAIIPKANQYIPSPTIFSTSNLSLRYHLLNPILDPIGAQWTYSSNNTNVYHMGRVGIGTTNPEYQLDVSGTLNAKAYYFNGVQIGRLSEGMVANVQHLTYTHMEVKNNTGWDAINDDLATGFVISITPKSNLSKILVNLIAHIGLTNAVDGRWWGIKLYRKIGTADWAEVTGPNGTETGSAATTAGTPVWISNNMGTTTQYYPLQIINLTGTYLDSPNTTSTVYYTAYWNHKIGDNPSATGNLWLNRAANQNDAYRPAPSSSWTLKEIWYG